MLDPARYLLGCAELLLLAGAAWLGASRLRSRVLPGFRGAPAALAAIVLSLALLIWTAEILGTVSLFKPIPYLIAVTALGLLLRLGLREGPPAPSAGGVAGGDPRGAQEPQAPSTVGVARATGPAAATQGPSPVPTAIALAIAAIAVIHFAINVKLKLSTGMTGFDSTWYHAPFAAGFFQSGNTFDLHLIAPQFLAWFYPANSEIFHAIGMLAFGRDLLSPLLNLGWLLGCLLACWCIGRPFGVAPWSLALGAIALSVPALSDQAGEARNDLVGIFFLLGAVAIALNAWGRDDGSLPEAKARAADGQGGQGSRPARSPSWGAFAVVGLAAGLAAGTKLNFLLPAAVLVLGLAVLASPGRRLRALGVLVLAALAGGGYWYLRNLVQAGNPLPWIHHLGPITLPAPQQALGGREAHSVLGYLTNGSVWSEWFLPGLHHGLWVIWPLLAAAALTGLLLALAPRRRAEKSKPPGRRADLSDEVGQIGPSAGWVGQIGPPAWVLAVAGLVGLASALAWLVAPTSASGPEGMPRGFESGLRYLTPALALGLALLPIALNERLRQAGAGSPPNGRILKTPSQLARRLSGRRAARTCLAIVVLLAIVAGYPIQRHYLRDRYANPSFTAPGLDAAFKWARDLSGARIATTSTRQYPLFGTDLSNHVQYLGVERPHGGFEAPTTCRQFRRLLDEGNYDYVVTTRDRLEPGKPPYPPSTHWTESPNAEEVLRKPPTVVFKLNGPLPPSSCPG